jgi:hypothetical protein
VDLQREHPQFTEVDGDGNVWVSLAQKLVYKNDCSTTTSLGFVQAGTNRALMFAPLSAAYPMFDASGNCIAFSGARVAYDSATRGMWFADYHRQRIGRIRP